MVSLFQLPGINPSAKALPCGQRIKKFIFGSLHSDFVAGLPRFLWEIGTKDESISFLILLYMRHAIIVGALPTATLEKMATYLPPYFMSQHPKRGAIYGPWVKLKDERVAAMALETVWWLKHQGQESDWSLALTVAVESATTGRADVH